jgi:hypothetical protein
MVEITVGLCESFKAIGIDISETDLRKFEQALYERGLNVAPRASAQTEQAGDASGSYMGTGSAYWNPNLAGR